MHLTRHFPSHPNCSIERVQSLHQAQDSRQLFDPTALSSLRTLLFGALCNFCATTDFGQLSPRGSFPTWRCDLTGQERSSWVQEPTHNADPTTAAPLPRPVAAAPAQPKTKAPSPAGATSRVRPQAQSNDVSCGQTSVAMAVNALTGKKLTDKQINARYGFSLLAGLRSESKGSGYTWNDHGDFSKSKWPLLEKKLNKERTPVLIGLNGPNFSRTGRGHIVTLLSIEGNKVRYADPADGTIKTTTKQAIENAGRHPDGNFLYCASKVK